jgi:hypothetical protein
MNDLSIPQSLRDTVNRELERDERIEWMGMPKRVFFTPVATGAFLFGIPWTAFALFWTAGAAQGAENGGLFSLFPFFGLPFILTGLGMLCAPIWAYWHAGKSVYVITDRRALTFDGGWSTTVRSYPPDKLTDVFRREKQDGSGDVIIARHAWRDADGDRQSEELGFLRVANAKDVERRLHALATRADAGERQRPAE